MEYYFIKTDYNYYGKNHFLLDISNGKYDNNDLALQVMQYGYKTENTAKKGINSLNKCFKRLGIKNNKYEIAKTKVIK